MAVLSDAVQTMIDQARQDTSCPRCHVVRPYCPPSVGHLSVVISTYRAEGVSLAYIPQPHLTEALRTQLNAFVPPEEDEDVTSLPCVIRGVAVCTGLMTEKEG